MPALKRLLALIVATNCPRANSPSASNARAKQLPRLIHQKALESEQQRAKSTRAEQVEESATRCNARLLINIVAESRGCVHSYAPRLVVCLAKRERGVVWFVKEDYRGVVISFFFWRSLGGPCNSVSICLKRIRCCGNSLYGILGTI